MQRAACRFFLVLWAVLSVAVLAQYLRGPAAGEELQVRLAYQLVILNFPTSLLLLLIPAKLPLWYLGFTQPGDVIVHWCTFTLAGFVQWALLLPWVAAWLRRLRNRRRTAGASES